MDTWVQVDEIALPMTTFPVVAGEIADRGVVQDVGHLCIGETVVALRFGAVVAPLVAGFGADGAPIYAEDLARGAAAVDPAQCDHAGATWSAEFDLRCPRCRSPLFLPPWALAQRSADDLAAMHALWRAAGWPELDYAEAPRWYAPGEFWALTPEPLFAHLGGLPVRHDKLAQFAAAAIRLGR